MRSTFSTLWLFATLNYLYCDVVSLMDPNLLKQYLAGSVGGMALTPGFLLAAGVLVEIPMAMILLSRVLGSRANRWANVGAGALMTVVQATTLLAGKPALYYVFFSVIEIGTTAAIVWLAWKLGAVQAADELHDRQAQAAWAERAGDDRQDRPQQLHVGPNGASAGTVTPEINPRRINERPAVAYAPVQIQAEPKVTGGRIQPACRPRREDPRPSSRG